MEFKSKIFGDISIEKDEFIKLFASLLEIKNFIYYDFEWTSNKKEPLYRILDLKKRTEYVMQCSYLATNLTFDSIDEKDNLIFDLSRNEISYDNLDYLNEEIIKFYKTIIDKLYGYIHNNHYLGVVYGDQEGIKLQEMASLINNKDYYHKIEFIKKYSIDLSYFFHGSSFSIKIKKLNNKFSLKILSELFTNYKCCINDNDKFKCIGDGRQINDLYASRLKNEISSLEWKNNNYETDLKQHCGNDVLRMITQMLNLYLLYDEIKSL